MGRILLKVKTYSGYKADERPRSFAIDERELQVEEVIDRWYGEGYEYFKVKADDGYIYIMKHGTGQDDWEMVMGEKGA